VADLIARVEALAGGGTAPTASSPVPRATLARAATPTPVSHPPPSELAPPSRDDAALPLGERWRAAVAEVERSSPAVVPHLKQGALLRLAAGEVALQFPENTSFVGAVERKRSDIEGALGRFFGRPTRLLIKVGPPVPASAESAPASLAAMEQAERQARSSALAETARGHPNVQEAARVLGADVAKVEEL
jgi:hypothetical protein